MFTVCSLGRDCLRGAERYKTPDDTACATSPAMLESLLALDFSFICINKFFLLPLKQFKLGFCHLQSKELLISLCPSLSTMASWEHGLTHSCKLCALVKAVEWQTNTLLGWGHFYRARCFAGEMINKSYFGEVGGFVSNGHKIRNQTDTQEVEVSRSSARGREGHSAR